MSKIVVNTTREIVSDFETLPVDMGDVRWVLYDDYLVERKRSRKLLKALIRISDDPSVGCVTERIECYEVARQAIAEYREAGRE